MCQTRSSTGCGQAEPPRRLAPESGYRMIQRGTKIVLEVLGVIVAGSAILLGLLAWRLSSGPIEADFLTPYLESAMSDGGVRLTLGGTLVRWDGFSRPLAFVAVDLRLADAEGETIATVPEVELAFNVPRLLVGSISPERIDLVRPKLQVTRTETGEFTFLIGDPDAEVTTDAELTAEEETAEEIDVVEALLRSLRAEPGSSDVPMASLRQLEITGGEIVIDDRLLDVTWTIPRADVDLSRADDAIRGGVLLDLQLGDNLAAVSAELDYSIETDETELEIGLANFVPAALAGIDPLLEPLAIVATPVFGTITCNFTAGLNPDRLAFVLQGGAGQLRVEEAYDMPLPVAGLALSGVVDVGDDRLVVDRFQVDLGGPSLRGSATVKDITGVLDVDAEALVENMPVDLLATYWPEALGTNARDWVTGNLSLGVVRAAGASIRARVPADKPDDGEVTEIGGMIVFDGVRVNYLDGLPAVHEVAGNATFDAERFDIALNSGRLRDLSLTGADIAITGLDQPIEFIDIELVLSGPAQTTLEVVDSPRLGYVSQLGIDPESASGSMAGRVRFTFPLINDVSFDQVGIAAAANLDDVGLASPELGEISGMNGTLNLDGRGMTIAGDATVLEVPLSFELTENFTDSRAFRTRVTANGSVSKADAGRLGIDFYGPWDGTLDLDATYVDLNGRDSTWSVTADLTQASVRLDEIGWQKPMGDPGTAVVEIALTDERITAIPSFAIDGAGLVVRGDAAFDPETEGVREILLSEFRYGETDVTAELTRLPNGGYAVNAYGPRLDARPLLAGAISGTGEEEAPAAEEPADTAETGPEGDESVTPLQVTVAFDEVIAGDGGKLYDVSGIAARDSIGWTEFDLISRTDTGGQVQSRYEPVGETGHQFSLTAEDAGAALRALDFTENISGGRLAVTGVQDERGGPLEGSIDLQEYRAVNMPALGRLLAALSLSGLQNVLSTEGLTFQKMTGEYHFADDVLSLREARTSGGALGLTMTGEFDIEASQMNVEGTIVPIYGVNQLIGAIPILGDLLTGGSGGGIFAFAYSVRGSLTEPEVAVNPLSVLAPGFVRNLFFLDNELGQSGVEPPRRQLQPRLNDDD